MNTDHKVPESMEELVSKQNQKMPEEIYGSLVKPEYWRWSKNPMWPHCYIVRDKVRNEDLFRYFCSVIQRHGFTGKWQGKNDHAPVYRQYFYHNGWVYWTMRRSFETPEWAAEYSTIINAAKIEDSYDCRLAEGRLPYTPSPRQMEFL